MFPSYHRHHICCIFIYLYWVDMGSHLFLQHVEACFIGNYLEISLFGWTQIAFTLGLIYAFSWSMMFSGFYLLPQVFSCLSYGWWKHEQLLGLCKLKQLFSLYFPTSCYFLSLMEFYPIYVILVLHGRLKRNNMHISEAISQYKFLSLSDTLPHTLQLPELP